MTKCTLHNGDCLPYMRTMDDNSVDEFVTDPPYGLDFMGKGWDHGVPGIPYWAEALRVAKPGAFLLAFGGTRTYHRLACAIEDAGWTIRDCISWIYGSGFPKSHNISKNIDRQEQNKWQRIGKALDMLDISAILEAWKINCADVRFVGLSSEKNATETGTNMLKSDSVLISVAPRASHEKSSVSAIIAELSSIAPHPISEGNTPFVRNNAEATMGQSNELAKFAGRSLEDRKAKRNANTFTVLFDAKGLPRESMGSKLRGVEALKTWLGEKKSSRAAAISALCADLTSDLKRIILSQSKTFQSLGTSQQTDFASAISVTITESTAARLISSTADMLKNKAIDKAAGAEREVVGRSPNWRPAKKHGGGGFDSKVGSGDATINITAPATDEAKLWDGYGTALKPAYEPIIVAMKPCDGTYVNNALTWGVAGLNIDECRVEYKGAAPAGSGNPSKKAPPEGIQPGRSGGNGGNITSPNGRWPANLILSWPEDEYALRDDVLYGDSGSAARFFKECKETDEEWLERLGLANTVGSSLSLKNERAVSVLNHVATGALPEGRQSSVVKAPSMSVTPSELRQLIESVIIMIQNIETACWQGPLPTKNILLPTGARYAAHQAQTGTMTTTLSHWKSGGSADPVTFNITPSNMEAGGRDWPRRAFYCAKASKAERTCGGKVENGHPTVKPLALMRYLVRLVKMPHGTIVMDPFAGSGTTGAACKLEGCDFIGCETDEKSFITAQQRYNATPEPLL